jgi:hypothetical protein
MTDPYIFGNRDMDEVFVMDEVDYAGKLCIREKDDPLVYISIIITNYKKINDYITDIKGMVSEFINFENESCSQSELEQLLTFHNPPSWNFTGSENKREKNLSIESLDSKYKRELSLDELEDDTFDDYVFKFEILGEGKGQKKFKPVRCFLGEYKLLRNNKLITEYGAFFEKSFNPSVN